MSETPEDEWEEELLNKRSYKPCPGCGMPIDPELIMCDECFWEEDEE